MNNSLLTHQPGDRDVTWGPQQDGLVFLNQLFAGLIDPPCPLTGAIALTNGTVVITSEVAHLDSLHFVIAMLDASGELQQGFGQNGFIIGNFTPALNAGGGNVAQGANGLFYMVGWSKSPVSLDPEIAILCFDTQGNRVPAFGINGQIIVPNTPQFIYLGGIPFIRTLDDGSIIVGANYAVGPSKVEIATLMKFDAQGKLVTSFGQVGMAFIDLPDPQASTSVKDGIVLSNGRILIAGDAHPSGVMKHALVAMLNPDGSFNPLFGDPAHPGRRLVSRNVSDTQFDAVFERASGKFLAAGSVDKSRQRETCGFVSGFDDTGKDDVGFNAGNPLETYRAPRVPTSWRNLCTSGADIYLAGGEQGLYSARLGLNGQPDPAFGQGGYVTEPLSPMVPHSCLVLYSSGLLLLGFNGPGLGGNSGSLIRYHLT